MENNNEQLTKKELHDLKRQEKEAARQKQGRSRSSKRVLIWLVSILILGGAVWGVIKLGGGTGPVQTGALTVDVNDADWSKGNPEAAVTLVEYSDFQCPACGAFYPVLKQIHEDYGDQLKFVYRHFPLKQIHPNAEPAARAAEAAGLQGKFWEMHDLLFENQISWSDQRNVDETFEQYASGLGLDIDKFKEDFSSGAVKDAVDADVDGGFSAGVNATPTFFLNGEKMPSPRSYDEFLNNIIEAINANS
ncbi:MAG: thioredoxin domain-containing protein [Candidatus Paceibacterota bacterium]